MDEFSKKIAEQILATFPEWRSLAREESAEAGTTFLVVEIPAPPAAEADHGLMISTENKEITVSFDFYHTHFDSWMGDCENVEAPVALAFVKQIVMEQVAVASWWFNDQWRGSSHWVAGASPLPTFVMAFNRIRIRSWNGSLNANISV